MKVLSVREPWASLIIEGKKPIELRTWKTRYRGRIMIHRSGKDGGIVGMAELVDIFEIKSKDQFHSLRDKHKAPHAFYKGKIYAWVLKNAKPMKFLPCKGRLGLWALPEDMVIRAG